MAQAKAILWPRLSYVCRIRSTAVASVGYGQAARAFDIQTRRLSNIQPGTPSNIYPRKLRNAYPRRLRISNPVGVDILKPKLRVPPAPHIQAGTRFILPEHAVPLRRLEGTGIGSFSSVCTEKSRPLPEYPGNLAPSSFLSGLAAPGAVGGVVQADHAGNPLLPKVYRGSTFALRRPHPRRLSR